MLAALVYREAEGFRKNLVLATILSGGSHASVVFLVHARTQAGEFSAVRLCLMLGLTCTLYAVSFRESHQIVSRLFETTVYQLRTRIIDKIRHAELQGIEKIGHVEIYTRLTQEIHFITNSAWGITLGIHATTMLIVALIHIATISTEAILVTLLIYGGGGFAYYLLRKKARILIHEQLRKQRSMFSVLGDLIHGIKEVQLHAKRGHELLADVREMAASLRASPLQINHINQRAFVLARFLLFMLLAVMVFVLPQIMDAHEQTLTTLVSAATFMFVPMTSLLKALSEYERADLAAESILAIEQRIEQTMMAAPANRSNPWDGRFSELRIADLVYQHTDAGGRETFAIGPLDMSIRAGEIVFLVGGNGSGKTTLLRLLSGLYTPSKGSLRVDDIPVGPDNINAYREMITAVFTDFHLFKKLYGLSDASSELIDRLLKLMQLSEQTAFQDNLFTTLALSTGQRKRLAMVVALLEDRPLYTFDEWAADQDPEFRRYYYEELLPDLKRRGKTVIAISHDDRYFHCADRVITMEYGAIRTIELNPQSSDMPRQPLIAS